MKTTNYNTRKEAIIEVTEDIKVFVLGDLEGKIDIVYKLLIKEKLIGLDETSGLIWTGPPNTYVVQCGDQLDNKHFHNIGDTFDIDIGLFLFMKFLYILSKGKVISILGNHELMNVEYDHRYVKSLRDKINGKRMIFLQMDIMKNIMRNRFGIFKIGNFIFSHAGVYNNQISFLVEKKLILNNNIDDFILFHNTNIFNNIVQWYEIMSKIIRSRIEKDYQDYIKITDTNVDNYLQNNEYNYSKFDNLALTYDLVWHRKYQISINEDLKHNITLLQNINDIIHLENNLPKKYIQIIGHNPLLDKEIFICTSAEKSNYCGNLYPQSFTPFNI